MNPFLWLCLPLRITARLGPQMELEQKLFSNSIPSLASLSMTGVGLTDFSQPLYAPMAWGAWSSVKTNKMLGRSDFASATVSNPANNVNRVTNRFMVKNRAGKATTCRPLGQAISG